MHMADSLLSPAVGGAMWAVSAGTIAYCSSKVRNEMNDSRVPLMGVLGAFIFAAQMINFSIPVTGSSGHLGGGLILAILLGPCAAFLTISSVLMVQALLFADGGLLALGCNIFNLGFIPAFVAYPYCYIKIAGRQPTATKITIASIIAAIAGSQIGALCVVLETSYSGISALPFSTFVAIMQPIHLAIGIVEGLVTASVVSFVYKARPEIMHGSINERPNDNHSLRNIIMTFLAATFVTAGIVSMFASTNPDGLEWSISKIIGHRELKDPEQGIHSTLGAFQEKTALLPNYSYKVSTKGKPGQLHPDANHTPLPDQKTEGALRPVSTGVSGLVGGTITLVLSFLIGYILKYRK